MVAEQRNCVIFELTCKVIKNTCLGRTPSSYKVMHRLRAVLKTLSPVLLSCKYHKKTHSFVLLLLFFSHHGIGSETILGCGEPHLEASCYKRVMVCIPLPRTCGLRARLKCQCDRSLRFVRRMNVTNRFWQVWIASHHPMTNNGRQHRQRGIEVIKEKLRLS